MNSNGKNQENYDRKINYYTEKQFFHIREALFPNLYFITDNGKILETDMFFDLCIASLNSLKNEGLLSQHISGDVLEWFNKRKHKIGNPTLDYEKRKMLLSEFFEDYSRFFGLDSVTEVSGLSGSIQIMITEIITDKSTKF